MIKDLTIDDRIYIAKYYGKVSTLEIATGIRGDVTKNDVEREVERQKSEGVYEYYRKMPEEEYEKLCRQEQREDKIKNFWRGGKKCQG